MQTTAPIYLISLTHDLQSAYPKQLIDMVNETTRIYEHSICAEQRVRMIIALTEKKIIPNLNFHRMNECGRVHSRTHTHTAPAEFHFSVYFVHLKAYAIHLSHSTMANKQVDFKLA